MFITFEGGEGTGKTTQINIIKYKLEQLGLEVLTTREPGGVISAEKIREVILNNNIDPITEAMLYAAARREHFMKKVKPALEENKIVLCDRFVDSSIVYQGIVRGIGIKEVLKINQLAIGNIKPDLTILFDLDPEIGLKRIYLNRTDEINRFDKEDISFHLKIREGYNNLKEQEPNRIHLIDAGKDIANVTDQIIRILKDNKVF